LLVRVYAGPWHARVLEVHRCPVQPAGQAGWEDLRPWLADHCQPGSQLDVLYQAHLLRVESFPRLGENDLESAMKTRLSRDLLLPLGDLDSHQARLDTEAATQGVFAAVLEETHLAVKRAIGGAQLALGRIGFAGQLALKALDVSGVQGGWTVLPGLAGAPSLLLARASDGTVLASCLNEAPAEAVRTAPERLSFLLPKGAAVPEPLELERAVEPLDGGEAVPSPLSFLLPVFLNEPKWRIASEEDLEYPYHFAAPTWGFIVAMLLMAVYSGMLWTQLLDNRVAAAEVERASREKVALERQEKELGQRLKDLDVLDKQIRGVGTEVFDNGMWLHYVGALRDRVAPSLIFDSVSVGAPQLVFLGTRGGVDNFLAFYEALTAALGDEAVRFQRLESDKDGKSRFGIQVNRKTSVPPRSIAGRV
jgi:hypothetical protein